MKVKVLGAVILADDEKQNQFEEAKKTDRQFKGLPVPYFQERELHGEYFYACGLGEDSVLYFKVKYPILDNLVLDYISEAKRRAFSKFLRK